MSAFHITTIVFIGSGFHAGMFDERELCHSLGEIETKDTERKQENGQYSYSRGNYRFSISPERLVLTGSKVFPKELTEAARAVIVRLAQYNPLPVVMAVELNCDSMFEQNELGSTGEDFCKALNHESNVESLFGSVIPLAHSITSTNFYFGADSVQYSLRIEPHFDTQGKNLFFSMNAHQDMTGKQETAECLDAVAGVRETAKKFHECLTRGRS